MKTYEQFITSIQFWGRLTLFLAACFSFAPAIYLYVQYGYGPDTKELMAALGVITLFMLTSYTIEPITYFPVLGLSGTYMSWLAGNISNLRLPVSAITQMRVGVKQGSPEGDLISTIGIGVSVVVNLLILIIVAVLGNTVIEMLPAEILKMFEYVLPSVMGALLFLFARKNMVVCLIVLSVASIAGLEALGLPGWVKLLACIISAVSLTIWSEKRKATKINTEGEV